MFPSETHLLAVDSGTSCCKAVLYDLSFREVAISRRENEITHPVPTWTEQDPQGLWVNMAHCIRNVMSAPELDPSCIAAVVICGQSRGFVLVGRDLVPLAPLVVWCDLRGASHAPKNKENTRTDISPYSPAAKLIWMKEHAPELLGNARSLLSCKDYLRAKLTGLVGTDPTDAWGSGLYDAGKGRWVTELVSAIGISDELLPEVNESSSVFGGVTLQAAKVTGLNEGTPVVTGAGDAFCTLTALSKTLTSDRVAIYLGSAPGILFRPDISGRNDITSSWNVYGRSLSAAFMSSAGLGLDWVRRISGVSDYETLNSQVEHVAPGSEGLVFLPHIVGERAPSLSPWERASFIGLNLGHQVGHMARAVMEGTAFQLRAVMDALQIADAAEEIALCGGGSRSGIWKQIISDVLGVPVAAFNRQEITALGAALIAALGVGICTDMDRCIDGAKLSLQERMSPDPQRNAVYDSLFAFYRRLDIELAALQRSWSLSEDV